MDAETSGAKPAPATDPRDDATGTTEPDPAPATGGVPDRTGTGGTPGTAETPGSPGSAEPTDSGRSADATEPAGPDDAAARADAAPSAASPSPAADASAPDTPGAVGQAKSDGRRWKARKAGEGRRSRRFPTFTRDTARPEGGGRAAPGGAPAPYRQWPLLTVMAGVVVGLLLMVADARWGALVVGGSVLAGAVLRRTVASVGMLAVRSRFTDLLTYGTLGTLIVLLALMLQPDPWLEIPFLKDILRFSVS